MDISPQLLEGLQIYLRADSWIDPRYLLHNYLFGRKRCFIVPGIRNNAWKLQTFEQIIQSKTSRDRAP